MAYLVDMPPVPVVASLPRRCPRCPRGWVVRHERLHTPGRWDLNCINCGWDVEVVLKPHAD